MNRYWAAKMLDQIQQNVEQKSLYIPRSTSKKDNHVKHTAVIMNFLSQLAEMLGNATDTLYVNVFISRDY